jgi:hypothetical protein
LTDPFPNILDPVGWLDSSDTCQNHKFASKQACTLDACTIAIGDDHDLTGENMPAQFKQLIASALGTWDANGIKAN